MYGGCPIVALALTKVWVNLLSTGESVSAYSIDRSLSHEMTGEIRTYAGGRQRSITSEGVRTTFSLTLRLVTAATLATLEAWMGRVVQVRDHRGQRFFCVYTAITPVEHKDPTLWDVQLQCRSVTVTEGV